MTPAIQGGMHQSRLGPWIPDHVRDDEVLAKCILTLRSEASRRVCPLKALHLQPLLRDGAIAPPQDESLCAPPSRPSRLIFSSLPRRWESRAACTSRAYRPGSRIKSRMTKY